MPRVTDLVGYGFMVSDVQVPDVDRRDGQVRSDARGEPRLLPAKRLVLRDQQTGDMVTFTLHEKGTRELDLTGIHWLIVGGESGPKHRPMKPEWVRDLRDRALAAGTAFFFKQWGGRTPKAAGRELDGRAWDEFPRSAAA